MLLIAGIVSASLSSGGIVTLNVAIQIQLVNFVSKFDIRAFVISSLNNYYFFKSRTKALVFTNLPITVTKDFWLSFL